jgi:hypothetical protein
MSYRTNQTVNVNGTNLQGYLGVKVTPEALTKRFGKARAFGCSKTNYEWVFVSDRDEVFTVYDYKSNIGPNTPYDWHIGAKSNRNVDAFRRWLLAELSR